MSLLVDYLRQGFVFSYGLLALGIFATTAYFRDGALSDTRSKEEEAALATARQTYWDLSKPVFGTIHHRFFNLRSGLKLHYVHTNPSSAQKPKNLVILLHGFPDSWILWRSLLLSPELPTDAQYVAVDLPGAGGSDSFGNYGAELILEAMADFVLGMREEYGSDEGKVVIVSHDWGAIIASRLCADAPQLADHFLITGVIQPGLAVANFTRHLELSKKMFHTYLRNPTSFTTLRKVFSTATPVFTQMRKSAYVFALKLPFPLATYAGLLGNHWFLRILSIMAYTPNAAFTARNPIKLPRDALPKELAAEAMASTYGPGSAQCTDESSGYPSSVVARTKSTTRWFSHRIGYYRDGLLIDPWPKSIETLAALTNLPSRNPDKDTLFSTAPLGAYKAPTTFLIGSRDQACEKRIGVDGIAEYLTVPNSHAFFVQDQAHWLPLQQNGVSVILKCLQWALIEDGGKNGQKKPKLEGWLGEEIGGQLKLIAKKE